MQCKQIGNAHETNEQTVESSVRGLDGHQMTDGKM